MPYAAGSRLGAYQVVAPLGEGGMGEVYRARDPRLAREVAIKVLPAALADDTERLRRFAQEARAAGALNHPNLLAVYELDEDAGTPFLVCELLEGETLRERLRRGPLPARRAVEVAAQVARGLAAAHDRGILHRDLKPENLFLTRDGRAKILDFGLAKLLAGERTHEPGDTASAPATAAGALLGTAGYMSPEQARGEPLDERSDLFAFGVVLFEALGGRNPFRRGSRVETLHAILHEEAPGLLATVPALPPTLERIVDRCLAKDPAARFHSAHDLAFALEALSGTSEPSGAMPSQRQRRLAPAKAVPWVVALLAVLVATALALRPRGGDVPAPLRAELMPPPLTPRELGLALSPSGRTLALVAPSTPGGNNLLWVRRLDEGTFRPLAGTEQADAAYPFWSPDGATLGFFSEGKLRRVPARGGPVEEICDAPAGRGGSWGADGTILFSPTGTGGIFRVPASGGPPRPVTRLTKPHETHRWPAWLPDGRHFLFVAWASVAGRKVEQLRLGEIGTAATRVLLADTSNAAYAPPGFLLFARAGRLLAQRFDLASLRPRGAPEAVGDDPVTYSRERGYAPFTVAANGTLVLRAEPPPLAELVWFDRDGRRLGTVGERAPWSLPRLSPDGRRVAVVRERPDARSDLWLLDLERGTPTRLTFQPARYWPAAWSPDGKQLAYAADTGGPASIFALTLGAGSLPRPLVASATNDYVGSWSRDGRDLLYEHQDPRTLNDIWLLPLAGEPPRLVLRTPFREEQATLSPDRRWLAYVSWESGRSEVYVVPFPRVEDGKWQLSSAGGDTPVWRADGRELFYATPDARLMAVTIETAARFTAGAPRPLVSVPAALEAGLDFDATSDGRRFLIDVPVTPRAAPLTLLAPWRPSVRH